jgi:hypothetical protein
MTSCMKSRKWLGVLTAVAMTATLATTASAGIFLPLDSALSAHLGALPIISVPGTYQAGGWATLTNNGPDHDLSDTASIWIADNVSVVTALLTGVALLDRLTLDVTNAAGSFTAAFSIANPMGGNAPVSVSTPSSGTLCPGGCLGGSEGLNGVFILGIGALNLSFAVTPIGVGGTAALPLGSQSIIATGAPFITGKARITAVTTNVIQVNRGGPVTGIGVTLAPAGTETVRTFTTGLGFRTSNPSGPLETQATVTVGGTNILASASFGGMVTLISPLRINTGALGVGNIPGFYAKKFVFVPEPGTVLLLVSGAAGLIFIGRKRMKK